MYNNNVIEMKEDFETNEPMGVLTKIYNLLTIETKDLIINCAESNIITKRNETIESFHRYYYKGEALIDIIEFYKDRFRVYIGFPVENVARNFIIIVIPYDNLLNIKGDIITSKKTFSIDDSFSNIDHFKSFIGLMLM